MQLLIETCEFPKNPSPRELPTRKVETRNIQSHPEPFVNHGCEVFVAKGNDRVRAVWPKLAPTKKAGWLLAIPPTL
jgi:hypothetical protein